MLLESGADISQALHKLTEPSMGYTIPSFSAYVPTSQKHKARDSAIPGEMLDDILQVLKFNPFKPNGLVYPYQ